MRNEKECVCSAPNILIIGKIIKEMPDSVASGTPYISINCCVTLLHLVP